MLGYLKQNAAGDHGHHHQQHLRNSGPMWATTGACGRSVPGRAHEVNEGALANSMLAAIIINIYSEGTAKRTGPKDFERPQLL